jgi:acyl-CoA synthetase (NDP forming)
VIPEYRAKEMLRASDVPFPEGRMAATLEDAKAAAAAVGYPVVLKAQSADLSHKSDAGGVIVGLADAQSLEHGWAKLQANIKRHRPDLTLDGVLVEKMGARGLELIVGARNDAEWGPVILVGFGGVQAEILQDVRLLTPDLGDEEIIAELGKLKSAALLHGFRGSPPLDVAAVAGIVGRVGRLLLARPDIREIDLNPVVLYARGEGAVALDALMLVDAQT